MNQDMINLANFIANELRTASPYLTGNMRRSIAIKDIQEDHIDIVISANYSSYVNDYEKNEKNYHWIQRTLDRCCRAYSQNNVDSEPITNGFTYQVINGKNKGDKK